MISQIVTSDQEQLTTANEYRTRWLMAHNTLHDIVHQTVAGAENLDPALAKRVNEQFAEYLAELRNSKEIASRPA